MRGAWRLVVLAACGLAACGNIARKSPDDGGVVGDDARPIDAAVVIDASVTPSSEIVGGAGRVTGATFTLDVQLGHPLGQQPTTGATYKLQGNAAIKP